MSVRQAKRPTIGVVLPNRNDARYLTACLRSVLDQEDPADQIVVIDDQSTDTSVDLIRSLIGDAPNATLLVNERNLGTFGAVEVALRQVNTDYVLFLSANDIVLPGIFLRARRCLAECGGAALWSAMAWLIDEDDRVIRMHPSAVVALRDAWLAPERCIELASRFGNWFTGTTCIYHRETLLSTGGFDPEYGAPSDLIAALTVTSLQGAVYTPEPYAAIRVHAGSFSSKALQNIDGLEAMLARIRSVQPTRSPRLFQAPFLRRIEARFRFAAIRATGGAAMGAIADRSAPGTAHLLHWLDRLLPASATAPRLAGAFVVLRPFDLLPTVWYRLLGWAVVRLRVGRRGRPDFRASPSMTGSATH